jgi:hypothetical protein
MGLCAITFFLAVVVAACRKVRRNNLWKAQAWQLRFVL